MSKEITPARSGVFEDPPDPLTEAFTQSHTFDRQLYKHDIAGSIAHARMLHRIGLLKKSELEAIEQGLNEIGEEIRSGKFQFRNALEDIHMHIETRLREKIGEPAGKLHTARSRNDQIALDERLWLRDEVDEAILLLGSIQAVLTELALEYAQDVMPAYTHLQRAQTVTCGHYLLAYVEMYERDKDRMRDARRRANVSPLGACALAGTSLPTDREFVAKELNFAGVTRNSMDSTADRDYLLDYAYAMSVCGIHMSRLCEDFILFSTTEFDLIQIDKRYCTGSSIMPQKCNPDIVELIRGRTGRPVALLNHLLMLCKGLPLTYNRDFQEDKELFFDTNRCFKDSLRILEVLLRNVTFKKENMRAACENGYMDATALAEYLVQRGIPFRSAHHVAGKLVRIAMDKGVQLSELDVDEMREVHSLLGEKVRSVLGPDGVVNAYASYGSPNPKFVVKMATEWRARLREEGIEPPKRK